MFCKYCGAPLAEDAVFCAKCGAKQTETPAAQPIPQPADPAWQQTDGQPIPQSANLAWQPTDGQQIQMPSQQPISSVPPVSAAAPAIENNGKKSKKGLIVAIGVIAVLLVAAGVLAILHFTGGDDGIFPSFGKSNSDNEASDDSTKSDPEKEQIDAAVKAAEAFAKTKDYENALSEINSALDKYPQSKDLQTKQNEYTEALAAQEKAKTLAEAADFAASGDYVSAIAVIGKATENNGEDAEYAEAYNQYCSSYKSAVISQADSTATGGDYLGAIQTIKDAMNVLSGDAELTSQINKYESDYVSDILKKADALIADKKLDEAKTLLFQSSKNVTNNELLLSKMDDIDSMRPVNLNTLHIIDSNSFSKKDGIYVDSFGNSYDGSFHFKYVGYSNEYAIFNLNKECTVFTGSIVACKETGSNEQMLLQIFVDDELKYTSPQFGKTTERISFQVDVTAGQQLKLKAGLVSGYWGDACFSIVDAQVTKDPEMVAKNLEEKQKNAYDPENAGLEKINLIDSVGYDQLSGVFTDSFGNSYPGAFHFKYVGASSERYAIYNFKEDCNTFSGSIVTCQDTGSNEQMVVMIFVDDVLKYTSPQFGKTTGRIDFSIDVIGAKKITIKAGLASGYWGDACFSIVNLRVS